MSQRKQIQYVNQKGMNKDISISKFTPEFIYDAYNIRLNSDKDNTLFSITNEKGNIAATLTEDNPNGSAYIKGEAIGYAVLNDYLVLFTTTRDTTKILEATEPAPSGTDRIYRIQKDKTKVNTLKCKVLFEQSGANSLNFAKDALIETLAIFEAEEIQKIYWIDRNNQPRFINISDDYLDNKLSILTNNTFNFSPELQLKEVIDVTKSYSGGKFHSGTIQYAFTYWNKNGVETNIFHTTPLFYISYTDRAGSAEEVCSNNFQINIKNLDFNFEYIRVYSIHRTSQDTVPNVRIVTDINLNEQKSEYTVTDDGIIGSTFAPDALNFIGGEELILGSITHKDNVLFAGNIKLNTPSVKTIQEELLTNPLIVDIKADVVKTVYSESEHVKTSNIYRYYPYTLDESSLENKHWKKGETYRFGIQAQYKNGRWSDPIYLGDDTDINVGYKMDYDTTNSIPEYVKIWFTRGYLTISSSLVTKLIQLGYKKVRPIYVPLTMSNRKVVSQGVFTKTLGKILNRSKNAPYAVPDYFTRPNREFVKNTCVAKNSIYPGTTTLTFTYYSSPGNLLETTIPTTASLKSQDFFKWEYLSPLITTTFTLLNSDVWGGGTNRDNSMPTVIPNSVFNTKITKKTKHSKNYQMWAANDSVKKIKTTTTEHFHKIFNYSEMYQHDRNQFYYRKRYDDTNWGGIEDFPVSLYDKDNFTELNIETENIDVEDGTNTISTTQFKVVSHNWFPDSNVVNFWSPETQFGELNNVDLSTISKVNFRGIANITGSYIKYDSLLTEGQTNGFSVGYSHLSPFADFELIRAHYDKGDSNTEFLRDILPWTNEYLNEKKDRFSWKHKKYSKYNISFFNDMFINNIQLNYDITKPKIIETTDSLVSYKTNKTIQQGSIVYGSLVDELMVWDTNWTTRIQYKANKHLLISLSGKYDLLPEFFQQNNTINPGSNPGSLELKTFFNQSGFNIELLNTNTYLGKSYDYLSSRNKFDLNGENKASGYPYLWIADLIREIPNQYSGKKLENIIQNNWIPCGQEVIIGSSGNLKLEYSEGDTFIQRYDCLRIVPTTTEITGDSGQPQRHTDAVSVWLESFINLDGRWDSHRYDLDLTNSSIETFNLNNPVYSQKDNFFNYNASNYNILDSDNMPTTFLWSSAKLYGASIDKWTSLWLNNSYTADGSLGYINSMESFKNDLYAFQDKGIFNIIYNPRVQVSTSDGNPIEIDQSGKMQGIRYISDKVGTTNKWSITKTNKALYFVDANTKDIYMLDSPPVNLSDATGFSSWGLNNITSLEEYNVYDNNNAVISNADIINDNIYFNSEKFSLGFSEKLNQMESFYSHEDIPFMFNIWGEFISIKTDSYINIYLGETSSLYINNKGKYNSFYGEDKASHIEYYVNPDMPYDKVFDNFQYRLDVFDESNNLIPQENFTSLKVYNEFQEGYLDLTKSNPDLYKKKFRIWSYPFPRNKGTLNRIRNPWVKMKFEFDNKAKNNKLALHDLIISYTV